MKSYTVIAVLVLFCIAGSHALSEEMLELMAELRKTCVAETGADPSLSDKALKGDWSDDEKFKCYVKCVMDQMSCISEDGVMDVDAVVELMPPEIKDKVEPAIRKCGAKIGANPCDSAWLSHKCYQQGMGELYILP